MNIQFLGEAGEIGRSAVLLDDALLLDFGMTTGNPPSFPLGDSSRLGSEGWSARRPRRTALWSDSHRSSERGPA